jgi:hypothetical protein
VAQPWSSFVPTMALPMAMAATPGIGWRIRWFGRFPMQNSFFPKEDHHYEPLFFFIKIAGIASGIAV